MKKIISLLGILLVLLSGCNYANDNSKYAKENYVEIENIKYIGKNENCSSLTCPLTFQVGENVYILKGSKSQIQTVVTGTVYNIKYNNENKHILEINYIKE